jgi:hypothetical protein
MTATSVLNWCPRIGDPHLGEFRGSDEAVFADVLRRAAQLLEQARVDYVVMGRLGFSSLGQPRWTHDIDFFLRPDEAKDALAVLEANGFRTEETDPWWLYKAFRDEVMVDLIVRSAGGIYFDQKMIDHSSQREIGPRGEHRGRYCSARETFRSAVSLVC